MTSGAGPVAIVGAAETAEIGTVALSSLGLATDAARRALADCGLTPRDVDGVAAASLNPYLPTLVAHSLGIEARWVDATMTGGCSNLAHLRHAAAAIATGQCDVVLVAHGESGRSHLGGPGFRPAPDSWQGQFELPFGTAGPMTLLTLGALRFLHDRGLDRTALARVVVAQREWASRNPRALRRDPIDVDGVLDAPLVAYPFTRPMCCVTTDAGGAVVVTSVERARDLPRPPVYVLGAGEATGSALASQMPDPTSSDAFRRAGAAAFAAAGITPADVHHAMLYDATAHIPLMALEDLGFVARGDSGAFVADGHTAVGGRLPVNTNGGGLNYTHSGMYGMYALQESIRQLRGEAAAQVEGITTSLTHAIGGMFQSAATVVLSTERT
ncbi:MAG TPA: thiolase [Acidimicrobiia bacterium]|nr:thiolase [Acidimicrobiia bacterium]